jgi:hypothetical protein
VRHAGQVGRVLQHLVDDVVGQAAQRRTEPELVEQRHAARMLDRLLRGPDLHVGERIGHHPTAQLPVFAVLDRLLLHWWQLQEIAEQHRRRGRPTQCQHHLDQGRGARLVDEDDVETRLRQRAVQPGTGQRRRDHLGLVDEHLLGILTEAARSVDQSLCWRFNVARRESALRCWAVSDSNRPYAVARSSVRARRTKS